MQSISDILHQHPYIPVVAIDHTEDIIPLISALMQGGIHCIEITLRTQAALAAIELAKKNFPDMCIAAGTVITIDHLLQLQALDIDFVVSPGTTSELIAAAQHLSIPYLPGVVTPSEIMMAAEHGLNCTKLFPASLAGGYGALQQYQNLFPRMQFCPTGGIDGSNCHDYINLKNVISVGGSWLAPKALIAKHDWSEITRRAKQAIQQ